MPAPDVEQLECIRDEPDVDNARGVTALARLIDRRRTWTGEPRAR